MASTLALGGLSLGAAPLGFAAAVGCTDGLRAQAAPAHAAPLHTATTAEVRIRFTRLGRKKVPFFRVVVMDSKTRRDGRPLEFLGWYDPLKKETQLDAPAIKKWIDRGAQPTGGVENLLKKALIIPAGEKKVYAQLSTKAAAALKAEKAAKIKTAQAAAAAKAKAAAAEKAAAEKAAAKAAADAAKAAPQA